MSKTMMQIELVTGGDKPDTIEIITTWVETDKRLKREVQVILKDDPRLWTVMRVYDGVELPYHELKANQGWDNNNYDKHDGTSMKKRLKS